MRTGWLDGDYGISPFCGCHGARVQVLAFVFSVHLYYIYYIDIPTYIDYTYLHIHMLQDMSFKLVVYQFQGDYM